MSKPKIGLIVGSVRPNRFADKPAQWIEAIAKEAGHFEVEVLDLKDYPMPFFNEPLSPAWGPSQNEVAQKWQAKLAGLDGFIIVAAEYNHGPTAVLKNAIDYAYKEWNKKPVAFVGYGGVGGARAVEQLRMHAVEMQMAPTKTAVHIVWGDMFQVMQGQKTIADFDHLNQTGKAMVEEFAWWVNALKSAREAGVVTAKAA